MTGLAAVAVVAAVLAGFVHADRKSRRIAALLPDTPATPAASMRLAHEREALAGLGLGFALAGVPGAWAGCAGGVAVAALRRRHDRKTRLRRIDAQIPELVRALTATLHAGGNLAAAFAAAAGELPEPIVTPVRAIDRRLATGSSLLEAVEAFRSDAPCDGAERLAAAIRTALEVGGPVADVLAFIGEGISERLHLDRERRAGTAQGRLSAIVVGTMPLAFLLLTGSGENGPGRILIGEPVGWMLLAVGAALELAGFAWVRRIVRG